MIPTVATASAPGRDITTGNITTATPFLGQKDQIDAAIAQQAAKQAVTEAPASPVTPVVATYMTVPEAGPSAGPKAPRKPRKPRNTVSIAAPGQTEMPVGTIDASGTVTPQVSAPVPVEVVPTPPSLAESAPPAPQVQVQAVPPNAPPSMPPNAPVQPRPEIPADKHAEFKAKNRLYTNDILVKGGMLPSDGIGGIGMKLRKFAIEYSKVSDTTQLTTQQWEQLYNHLDSFYAQFGETQLVAYINKTIGVA